MPTARQFVLALMAAVLWVVVAAVLSPSPAWLFGGGALLLAFVYAGLLRDPTVPRRGPAALVDTSFLVLELVLFLLVGGYFRLWMVVAFVLATMLASAAGLFTQGRERRQIAMYTAIGLPVILVLALLVFANFNVPFFWAAPETMGYPIEYPPPDPDGRPHIWFEFSSKPPEVDLNRFAGSAESIREQQLELSKGLEVVLYYDDGDEWMLADAIVDRFNPKHTGSWIVRVDWSTFRRVPKPGR
jgi:hypothetical protein